MKEARLVEGFSSVESASFDLRVCDLHKLGIYQPRLTCKKECDLGGAEFFAIIAIQPADE